MNPMIWRLREAGENNLGLACTEEGLLLARTSLIERRDDRFVVRGQREIERLLSRAYRTDLAADRLMPGLATVAAALNANDQCLARIAAVHLRIPDLPNQAARDDMEAEDILIKSADWDAALHPRIGTPPNPGWFAPTGGTGDESSPIRTAQNDDPARRPDASPSAGDGWVRLPPGPQRIDELADFVEWIANARPEDEQAIRAEIKRYFYDVGDQGSANALNGALTVLLRPGITQEDRQKLLDNLDVFTRVDPAEWVQNRNFVTGAALLAAAITSPAEAWKSGWATRGRYFEEQLSDNSLHPDFETIDNFSDGIATSIKSIDLNAATYQKTAQLTYTLNKYVNDVSEYDGGRRVNDEVASGAITGRVLSLAIPKASMTETQRIAIEAVRARAKTLKNPVEIVITEF
jgi:hypothetical protein